MLTVKQRNTFSLIRPFYGLRLKFNVIRGVLSRLQRHSPSFLNSKLELIPNFNGPLLLHKTGHGPATVTVWPCYSVVEKQLQLQYLHVTQLMNTATVTMWQCYSVVEKINSRFGSLKKRWWLAKKLMSLKNLVILFRKINANKKFSYFIYEKKIIISIQNLVILFMKKIIISIQNSVIVFVKNVDTKFSYFIHKKIMSIQNLVIVFIKNECQYKISLLYS